MSKTFAALALVVISFAGFIWGLTTAQAAPLTCGFLLWTPAIFFFGWALSSLVRGRRVRVIVAEDAGMAYGHRVAANRRPARVDAHGADDYARLSDEDDDPVPEQRVSMRRQR